MSKFFFHLRGRGVHVDDPVGLECRDAAEARRFALGLAEDIAADDHVAHRYPPCAYLDVEDEEQRPLFMVPLRVSDSAR